ncbi:MAG: peptidase S8 [Idiomarina sp.]|nr:peptidase S8 [Idiomarina sp.]
MAQKQSVVPKLTIVAACVASAVSFGAAANNFSAKSVEATQLQYGGDKLLDKNLQVAKQEFPTYYIVQLEAPSVVMAAGEIPGAMHSLDAAGNRLNMQSSGAQAYQQQLLSQQASFVSQLNSRFNNVAVERNLTVAMNGLVVAFEGDVDYLAQLRAMPGVKAVFEHEMFYANMDASLELINQPEVAAMLGGADRAGEGVKVAIIDGGIRPENPMFASNGHVRPSDLPTDDYCATIDASFCNDKLVLARFYTPTFAVHPSEYISPLDLGGHGTHVAGTAVGNPVVANYAGVDTAISGVAPGASLMVYKALFRTPTSPGGGSNIMLVGALEDAIADGADVVNNSWGGAGGANPANSPYTPIFEAAEEAGVLMVTAAGNDGFAGVGCPACAEPGLAVASTQTGRVFANPVSALDLDDMIGLIGDGDFEISEEITGPLMPVMAIDAANDLACEPFPAGSLDGHIAMVARGECAFGDKADNVQAAGAIGMILWNNTAGTISMSMPDATLPSVSITLADGVSILEALEAAEGVGSGTIAPTQAIVREGNVDVISSFSSRGPNGDSSFLKPDLAAPGSDILSAHSPDAVADFNSISGTSMASPHVAGAAALLLQQNPDLDARQLKSMLMTSTSPTVLSDNGEDPASPFDRGAGRLDVAAAANTGIVFDGPSINSNACNVRCSFTRTAYDVLEADGVWEASINWMSQGVSGSLDTDRLEFDEDGQASFELTVDVRFAEPGWKFGEVVWSDTSGQFADARLPIVVNAGRSDDSQVNQTVLMGDVAVGEPIAFMSRAGYPGTNSAFSFTVTVPEGFEIDRDSVELSANRASQTGFSFGSNNRTMAWSGSLTTSEASVTLAPASGTAFPFAGLSLTDLDDVLAAPSPRHDCSSICDEIVLSLPVGNFGGFTHNGTPVNTLYFSENGMTTADFAIGTTFITQALPSTAQPNNVIAPFWADFEIADEYGSELIYNIISDGTSDWLVIEWNNVSLWNQPDGNRFTFAQWIKLGSDEVYFNYIDIPAAAPATIGLENIDGTIGGTYYRNGTGDLPANSSALRAGIQPADLGFLRADYEVMAPFFGTARGADLETSPAGELEIDMSGLYSTSMGNQLVRSVLQASTGTYESVMPVRIAATGDVTVEIVEQPELGTVTLVAGEDGEYTAVYTPNGEQGEDSFTYRVVDEDGATTNTATVNVSVVNTPPVAAATGPGSIRGGGEVTLSASGSSDADGDTLSFSWTQVSGPSVSLSGASSAVATFDAPNDNATLVFAVTVSDGIAEDTAQVTVNTERRSSKKWYEGGFGAALAVLGLPLVWLRRRALKAKR